MSPRIQQGESKASQAQHQLPKPINAYGEGLPAVLSRRAARELSDYRGRG